MSGYTKDPRCKCSMRISLVGDGCRYCQPQEYIDRLETQASEDAHAVNCRDDLLEALNDLARYADECELCLQKDYPNKAQSLRLRVTKAKAAIAKADKGE